MLRLFPLRRSFSLDLAPDDSNSNFLFSQLNDDNNQDNNNNISSSNLSNLHHHLLPHPHNIATSLFIRSYQPGSAITTSSPTVSSLALSISSILTTTTNTTTTTPTISSPSSSTSSSIISSASRIRAKSVTNISDRVDRNLSVGIDENNPVNDEYNCHEGDDEEEEEEEEGNIEDDIDDEEEEEEEEEIEEDDEDEVDEDEEEGEDRSSDERNNRSQTAPPLPHNNISSSNMSTAIGSWSVDIDDALAADFDGSLLGLGTELGTASFNMSEALMALPSLSSLKHNNTTNNNNNTNTNTTNNNHSHEHHHNSGHHNNHSSTNDHNERNGNDNSANNSNNQQRSNSNANNQTNNLTTSTATTTTNHQNTSSANNLLFTSSLMASLRMIHGHDGQQNLTTSSASTDERNNDNNRNQHNNNSNNGNNTANSNSNNSSSNNNNNNNNNQSNNDEKPIAVVHGKKNRLMAFGHDDESISIAIKRFCSGNEGQNNHQQEHHSLQPEQHQQAQAQQSREAISLTSTTTTLTNSNNGIGTNIHLLIPNNLINSTVGVNGVGVSSDDSQHHNYHQSQLYGHGHLIHQQPPTPQPLSSIHCNEECLNGQPGELCTHLRYHSTSSLTDLRTSLVNVIGGVSNGVYSPTLPTFSHSAGSSPSSPMAPTPTATFFSHIISSQCLSNNPDNIPNGAAGSPISGTSTTLVEHHSHHHHHYHHLSTPNAVNTNTTNNKSDEQSKFQYVLGASTSMAIKMNEETMTYLNQGQSYEIKLKKVGDLSEMKGKMLKTILRVCFHDRRLQYIEKELIEQWKEQRPSERALEVDIPLSYGINDVRNDPKYINRCEFYWDPTKETGVFIRINCISTEFTPKKHGGEKGVPFRLLIETYSKDDLTHWLHAASCQVKVFKPKGADRKHKTDKEKMARKPVIEQEKFQPSYDCTVFTDCSMDTFSLYNMSSGSFINNDIFQTFTKSNGSLDGLDEVAKQTKNNNSAVMPAFNKIIGSSRSTSPPSTEKFSNNLINHILSDINDNSYEFSLSAFANYNTNTSTALATTATSATATTITTTTTAVSPFKSQKIPITSTTSSEEVQKWLKENRFDAYMATFENFSGMDVLLLSKNDLIQICGLTDGIRLFNGLHGKCIKPKLSIYVCLFTDELFRAIYLDSLTVNELETKLISTLLPGPNRTNCTYLKRFCIVGPLGVKILITDEVVRNIQDESLYIVEFTKDYKGEMYALMKRFNNNSNNNNNNNNNNNGSNSNI